MHCKLCHNLVFVLVVANHFHCVFLLVFWSFSNMVAFKLWWVFVNGIMDWLLGSNDCLHYVFKTFFWVHYAFIESFSAFQVHFLCKKLLPLQMKIKSKPNLVGSFNKIVVNKGENCLISTSRFMLSLDLDLAPALKNQRKKECNQWNQSVLSRFLNE